MKKYYVLTLCLIFCIIAIILNPATYIQVSFNAIEVWAKILLPSLLPFFIFTKILTSLETLETITKSFSFIAQKVYKTAPIASYVFFISILTGYPVGSKLVGDLYKHNKLTATQAKRCIAFTSNSGPMFILGSVGIGMLLSKNAGYIILISHILGALINGIIYRNSTAKKINSIKKTKIIKNTNDVLISSVSDSINSILLIGGLIVFSFILIEILNNLNAFFPAIKLLEFVGVNQQISSSVINGFFEVTKGTLAVSLTTCSLQTKTVISCALISFGGICTMFQAMAFLNEIISYKFFFLQKITHMIFSTLICTIFCCLVL